jgi:hypothetical protein
MRGKRIAIVIVALLGLALVVPVGDARAHEGWAWGPAAFAGGLLLGSLARPWYGPPAYVYPPPAVAYAPPPVYYVPNQTYVYAAPPSTGGQWVQIPGQWVNGVWVPAHRAWAPNAGQ